MSDAVPSAPEDEPIVRLLEQCLLRMEQEGSGVLDEMCSRHPEHAEALRQGVRFLRREAFVADDPTPERLGEYRLLRRLGGGGMGEVFLAEQSTLGRRVAIKLIRPELVYFAGSRARFRREAEAIARLQHPGIVPVHAAGEEAGIPYFAMDYVEGASLACVLRELAGRSPDSFSGPDLAGALQRAAALEHLPGLPYTGRWWQIVAEIVRQVAEATAHAHERGVLHRDLKPSNVMLGIDGRVQLVDFGLARSDGDAALTNTGTPLGSLAYMAPEQVQGSRDVDERTDVYGLGVTLYELLTMRCPFLTNSSESTRARILAANIEPPRRWLRSLPRDLESVCLQAMAPEAERRYARMADLAHDLGNALAHRPVAARRAGPWRRLLRYGRRHPARLALAALASVAVPTISVLALARYHDRPTVVRGLDAERTARISELLLTGWTSSRQAPGRAREAFANALRLDASEPLAVVGLCFLATNAGDAEAARAVMEEHNLVVARYPMFALLPQMARFDAQAPFPLPEDADIPATATDWFLVGTAAMQRADRGEAAACRRAIACFDQAILLSADAQAVFHMRRCEALVASGERQRARQAVQVLAARWPDSPGVMAFAGGALIGADPPRAQELLDRALALDPRSALAWGQLGRLRFLQGDKPGYLAAVQRAAQVLPDDGEIWKELASAQSVVDDVPAALASIETALRLSPGLAEAHVVHGDVLARLGRFDEALAAWGRAERLAPALPLTYYMRAQGLMREQRYAEAAADLHKAIDREPGNAVSHGSLAIACRRMQDWAGARAAATEAVRLAPSYAYWRLELAVAQWKLGEVAEASQNLTEVVRGMPDDEEAHAVRLRVAEQAGDTATKADEDARWQLRKAR